MNFLQANNKQTAEAWRHATTISAVTAWPNSPLNKQYEAGAFAAKTGIRNQHAGKAIRPAVFIFAILLCIWGQTLSLAADPTIRNYRIVAENTSTYPQVRGTAAEPCRLLPVTLVELANVQAHSPWGADVYRLSMDVRVDRGEWQHLEQTRYAAEPTLRVPTAGVSVGIRAGEWVEFCEAGFEARWE